MVCAGLGVGVAVLAVLEAARSVHLAPECSASAQPRSRVACGAASWAAARDASAWADRPCMAADQEKGPPSTTALDSAAAPCRALSGPVLGRARYKKPGAAHAQAEHRQAQPGPSQAQPGPAAAAFFKGDYDDAPIEARLASLRWNRAARHATRLDSARLSTLEPPERGRDRWCQWQRAQGDDGWAWSRPESESE